MGPFKTWIFSLEILIFLLMDFLLGDQFTLFCGELTQVDLILIFYFI